MSETTLEQDPAIGPSDALERLSMTELARRVRQLEETVVELQNTRELENRIVKRLRPRRGKAGDEVLAEESVAAIPESIQAEGVAPVPVPLALAPAPESSSNIASGLPPVSISFPIAAPSGLAAEPAPAWLLFELYTEMRNMVAMFFDVHFQLGWWSRMLIIVLVTIILTGSWWIPLSGVPLLGPIMLNIVNLFLAFFVYKLLTREARRYQAFRQQERNMYRPGG